MCKFRCRSTNLPISTSFVYNTDDEWCKMCNLNETGDEFHYIMKCPYFSDARKKLCTFDCNKINCLQMKKLFISTNTGKLKLLSSLIKCILSNCATCTNSNKKDKKLVVPMYIPKPITRAGRLTQQPVVLDL